MTNPGNDGIPQHAATTQPWWESSPFRTTVQGISLDLALALALLIYQTTSAGPVDWRLLGLALIKTALMTLASSVMKYVKPRQTADEVTA